MLPSSPSYSLYWTMIALFLLSLIIFRSNIWATLAPSRLWIACFYTTFRLCCHFLELTQFALFWHFWSYKICQVYCCFLELTQINSFDATGFSSVLLVSGTNSVCTPFLLLQDLQCLLSKAYSVCFLLTCWVLHDLPCVCAYDHCFLELTTFFFFHLTCATKFAEFVVELLNLLG